MISFHENYISQESETQISIEEEIISIIKDYGPNSSEAMDIFFVWLSNKQKEYTNSEDEYSQLKFDIEVSSFCLKAGLIDQASKYCNYVWDFASKFKFLENEFTDDFLNMHKNLLELSDNIDKENFNQ